MSQKNIVKPVLVANLSGSSATITVSDIDFTKATVGIYSAAVSGTYDFQASVDGFVWTSLIGGAKNTGPGAAAAVGTQFPQTSGSYQFARLSNTAAGTFAMAGGLSASIAGGPFLPSP